MAQYEKLQEPHHYEDRVKDEVSSCKFFQPISVSYWYLAVFMNSKFLIFNFSCPIISSRQVNKEGELVRA